jgi:hypothetical protein
MKTFKVPLQQYMCWCKNYPLVMHDYIYANNHVIVQIKISLLKQMLTGGYKLMK